MGEDSSRAHISRTSCSNFPCSTKAHSTCKNCHLVQYCGPECQKMHWHASHKVHCKSPLLSKSWQPLWEIENRTPGFVDNNGPPITTFGALKYLWGNVPAFDVLKLANNEGHHYRGNLNILFAASGDPRNLMKTIACLPATYSGRLHCVLNDRDLDIVARNAILLLTAMVVSPDQAAETIIHLWYSALIPSDLLQTVQDQVLPLIQGVCAKIEGKQGGIPFGKTWKFGNASLRLVLEKGQWYQLKSYLEIPKGLSSDGAEALRAKIMLAPERLDYVERDLFKSPPGLRMCKAQFRKDGILVPFWADRAPFNTPNPTFFQTADRWPMMDASDPLLAWSESDLRKQPLPAKDDAYGRLYFYLVDLIKVFCNRLRENTISLDLFHVDATALPDLLATNSGNRALQFDRIELSNISDTAYLGPAVPLKLFGPLLKTHAKNPYATLITLFLNAVPQMQYSQGSLAHMTSSRSVLPKALEYLPMAHQDNTQSAALHKFMAATDMFINFDSLFNKFIPKDEFVRMGKDAGVCMKTKHTVIEPWPLRLKKKHGQPGAQEEFERLLASSHSGWERYIEWKRI